MLVFQNCIVRMLRIVVHLFHPDALCKSSAEVQETVSGSYTFIDISLPLRRVPSEPSKYDCYCLETHYSL